MGGPPCDSVKRRFSTEESLCETSFAEKPSCKLVMSNSLLAASSRSGLAELTTFDFGFTRSFFGVLVSWSR